MIKECIDLHNLYKNYLKDFEFFIDYNSIDNNLDVGNYNEFYNLKKWYFVLCGKTQRRFRYTISRWMYFYGQSFYTFS